MRPISSSPSMAYWFNSSSNNTTPPTRDGLAPFSTTGDLHQSRETSHLKHTDGLLPKRTRSPTFPSMSESFTDNHVFALDGYGRVPDSQSRKEFSKSGKANSFEVPANKPLNFPVGKRAKLPLLSSSDQVIQDNSDSAQEIERELQSKAKRLARFKDELSQPKQNATTFRNQQHALEKPRPREDSKMDATADFIDSDVISDYHGGASSGSIVGVCPDMCPGHLFVSGPNVCVLQVFGRFCPALRRLSFLSANKAALRHLSLGFHASSFSGRHLVLGARAPAAWPPHSSSLFKLFQSYRLRLFLFLKTPHIF